MFINVIIIDQQSELQCVDTSNPYSRSIFYSSSLEVQYSKSGESYNVLDRMSSNAMGRMPGIESYIVSIWIIINEMLHK